MKNAATSGHSWEWGCRALSFQNKGKLAPGGTLCRGGNPGVAENTATPSLGLGLLYYGHPQGWPGTHKARTARTQKVFLKVSLGHPTPCTGTPSSSSSAMKHHSNLSVTGHHGDPSSIGLSQFLPGPVPHPLWTTLKSLP